MRVLAADIGGTNSRFGIFEGDASHCSLIDSIWIKTHSVTSFDELLSLLWESSLSISLGDYDGVAIAVAGGVHDGVLAELSNAPWSIDLRKTSLGTPNVWLVNDFSAQAYACQTSALDGATILQKGKERLDTTIGVIGAGTGLGYSALLPTQAGWTAIASEGGHMVFPFVGEREAEYGEFNRTESNRRWAEGDSVVTGLGLELVHQFLTGEKLKAPEVAAKLTLESETTHWFSRFLARACRNWCLGVMAHGGLVIAGGVVAKNPILVESAEFLKEFHNTHIYAEFLQDVPLILNANEDSGLYGAGFYAMQQLTIEKRM